MVSVSKSSGYLMVGAMLSSEESLKRRGRLTLVPFASPVVTIAGFVELVPFNTLTQSCSSSGLDRFTTGFASCGVASSRSAM